MKHYHYTIADRLVRILIDGFLKLTPEPEGLLESELQFVWVTSNPNWDNTAFFGYPISILENAGMIRITLNKVYSSPKKFYDFMPSYDSLVEKAYQVSVDPEDWGVSDSIISISDFEKIELWKDNKWIEIPININQNLKKEKQ